MLRRKHWMAFITLVVFLVAGCGFISSDKDKKEKAAATKNQQETSAPTKPEPTGPMAVKPGQKAKVNEPVVNVRSGPAMKSNLLRQLKKGETVTIQKAVENDEKEVWFEITAADGKAGYIRHDLLIYADGESTAPTGSAPNSSTPKVLGEVDKSSLEKAISGKWRATQFFIPGVTAMSLPDAAKWMGRTGTIAMNRIEFSPDTHSGINLKGQLFRTKDYYKNTPNVIDHFKITSEQVWVVDSGKTGPFSTFVAVGNDSLLTTWDGVVFLLERAK